MNQTLSTLLPVATLAIGFAVGRWSAALPPPPPQPVAMAAPSATPSRGGFLPHPEAPEGSAMQGAADPGVQHDPNAEMNPAMNQGTTLQGVALEVIQVPTYTYVRLKMVDGEDWAAIESNPSLEPGAMVMIDGATLMEHFSSKTLNRSFDRIYFGHQRTDAEARRAAK